MVGKYKVITLCGSTRFKEQFLEAQKRDRVRKEERERGEVFGVRFFFLVHLRCYEFEGNHTGD